MTEDEKDRAAVAEGMEAYSKLRKVTDAMQRPGMVSTDGLTAGAKLRHTCLHDNGDGTFALTLLVDVRGSDIGTAAELLAGGRRLQAAFDAAPETP